MSFHRFSSKFRLILYSSISLQQTKIHNVSLWVYTQSFSQKEMRIVKMTMRENPRNEESLK